MGFIMLCILLAIPSILTYYIIYLYIRSEFDIYDEFSIDCRMLITIVFSLVPIANIAGLIFAMTDYCSELVIQRTDKGFKIKFK